MELVKKYIDSLIVVIVIVLPSIGSNVLVTDIKKGVNDCDYCIITPQLFKENAIKLAEYRNAFSSDDVFSAKVVLLENLYAEFKTSDTIQNYEAIWLGVKHMYTHWNVPFKYLVLVGDDSISLNPIDSCYYSYGIMPSYLYNNHKYNVKSADNMYGLLNCETIPSVLNPDYQTPLTIGRIPCETNLQFSNYLKKVVSFDALMLNGHWKNTVCIVADDNFLNTSIDPINHGRSAERIVNECFNDYFVSKCYLSTFTIDEDGNHPNGKKFFFDRIKEGSLFSIFFGHGHHNQLTDEVFLNSNDYPLFKNDSIPTMFFSFSCSNGAFHISTESSMCKQFLFTPQGGCVIYFASPQVQYASTNELYGIKIFKNFSSSSERSIGTIIQEATKLQTVPFNYYILGDPAIPTMKKKASLSITAQTNGYRENSLLCSVTVPTGFIGTYQSKFYVLDSVSIKNGIKVNFIKNTQISKKENPFNTSFLVHLPKKRTVEHVRFTAYVWNKSYEARIDTVISIDLIDNISHNFQTISQYFRISETNNNLMIKIISQPFKKPIQYALYTMRGQNVYSRSFEPNQKIAHINLNKMSISPGNYFLEITFENQRFSRKVFYLPNQ